MSPNKYFSQTKTSLHLHLITKLVSSIYMKQKSTISTELFIHTRALCNAARELRGAIPLL